LSVSRKPAGTLVFNLGKPEAKRFNVFLARYYLQGFDKGSAVSAPDGTVRGKL